MFKPTWSIQCLRELDTFPDDAPVWLTRERFASGGPYYRWVGPDQHVMRRFVAVQTWLSISLADDAAWLYQFDCDGRISRLRNIGTLDHAYRLARKSLAIRRASSNGAIAGTQLVLVNPNGTRWVKLLSRVSLRREGFLMRHCLSSAEYGSLQQRGVASFYSLRDASGRHPKVTASVLAGRVAEARAFADKAPDRYRGEIKALARHVRGEFHAVIGRPPAKVPAWRHLWGEDESTCLTDLIAPAHRLLRPMPRRLHVMGSMDLSMTEDMLNLPDVLIVDGDLLLRHCWNVRMPRWLRVKGSVDLTGCLYLAGLPRQILVGADLNLTDCHQLSELPPGLHVGRWLTLTGSKITRLPTSVRVGEGVSFGPDSHMHMGSQWSSPKRDADQ